MDYNTRQTCNAIITVISNLKHSHMAPDEINAARDMMDQLLSDADRLGISWKLQNALLYVGEHYDVRAWYLDQLFAMACARINCNGTPLFQR